VRLTTKLIRHILMPAVILALFMGLTYRYYNLQHARSAVAGDLSRTGQIITQLLNYRVNENEQELTGLLSNQDIRALLSTPRRAVDGYERSDLELACARAIQNSEGALAIDLVDARGRRVFRMTAEGPSYELEDVSEQGWFRDRDEARSSFSWTEGTIGRITHGIVGGAADGAALSLVFDVAKIVEPAYDLATNDGLTELHMRLFGADNELHIEIGDPAPADDDSLFGTTTVAFCDGMIEFHVPSTAVLKQVELYEMQVLLITSLIFFVLLCSIWIGLRENVLMPVDGMMNVVEAFQRGEKTPAASKTRRHSNELDELDRTLRGATDASYKAQELLNALNLTLEEHVVDRTRELRTARDAARAASRAKSAFLANMSHEIRTPLNGILGMTYPLVDAGLDENQVEAVAIIRSSAESLLAIINDILDISRIEAGKLTVDRVPFDLKQSLESIVRMLQNEAHAKGLALNLYYGTYVPPCVYGDAGRIRQVLINLVSNAIKFTEQGGVSIGVRVDEQEGKEAALVIEVVDTGIGVEPEQANAIFDAFSQADTSTTREYSGAGLGLAISRQLAEALGGSLTLESEVGRGSTFTVRLKFEPADASEGAAWPDGDGGPSGGGWRILVADDDAAERGATESLLRRMGCEVECVESGREAIARLERGSFHLVLLACQPPGLDGYETTHEIRKRGIAAGTPIVAMRADATIRERDRCLRAGMDDFIAKPCETEAVRKILTKWLAPGAISLSA